MKFKFNFETYKGEMEKLYKEAIEIVKIEQKCSPSLLQRKLMIGYGKASELVDMLEEKCVIGKNNGAKPREVFIK